jgi:hypothetical protein
MVDLQDMRWFVGSSFIKITFPSLNRDGAKYCIVIFASCCFSAEEEGRRGVAKSTDTRQVHESNPIQSNPARNIIWE